MIKSGKQLISLISSVINSKKIELDINEINFKKLIKLAKFHNVESLLYQGITYNNLEIPNEYKVELNKLNLISVSKEATQEYEKEIISQALEKSQIKHVFLKGSVIKHLYPSPHLRSMADLDILIEPKKLKALKGIMISLNYTVEQVGGNHDVYHKLPFMNIEMHRGMIDESYEFSKYYKNIWDKVIKCETKNYEYYLSDEDYYIYMLVHCFKHFSHGGTGIRSIVDFGVYLKHKENSLDFEYINKELEKLDLLKFSKNMCDLSNVWFNDHPSNESLDAITEYIITSGTYGISSNLMIVRGFLDGKSVGRSKFRYLLSAMFPSFKKMKRIYPSLKFLPFLLPIYWGFRLLRIVFVRRTRVKNVYSDITKIDQEKIDKLKDIHNKSGIN